MTTKLKLTTETKLSLYLVEYYTKSGFIRLAWVGANDAVHARAKLATHVTASFEEAITTTETAYVCKLATSKAPLFIDVQEYHLNKN